MIIIAVVLIAALALIFGGGNEGKLNYTSARADRGEVSQTVSATGAVEAIDKVDLKFLNSGRIAQVNVKVGDEVKEGQVLAMLDMSKLDSQKAQAQASLTVAEANLNTLLDGATNEEVRLAQTAVDNAAIAVSSAKQSLEDTRTSTEREIASAESSVASARVALDNADLNLSNVKSSNENSFNNAYETAWDTVTSSLAACDDARNANDDVLDDDEAENLLSVKNSQYLNYAEASRMVADKSRDEAEAYKNSVAGSRTHDNIDTAISKTQVALDDARKALSDTYDVLQNTITSASFTQADLDGMKSSISMQRGYINSAISNMNTKKQSIQTQKVNNQISLDGAQSAVNTASSAFLSAQNGLGATKAGATAKINAAQNAVTASEGNLKSAQDQLAQVKATPSSSKVSSARAQVSQAQASVDLIQGQIDDSTIKAPYDGVITGVVGEVNEVASLTEPVIAMMIPGGFQITSNVSEVSISKVKVGDKVEMTFDALGSDEEFEGKVSEIDPAQTEIAGVIYYKVTTVFTADGNVVKAGMTANLDVLTAKKEDVIRVPFQAIKEKDGARYVQIVVSPTEIKDVPVEIGLKGDNYIEVTSGLEEGQEVATFVEE